MTNLANQHSELSHSSCEAVRVRTAGTGNKMGPIEIVVQTKVASKVLGTFSSSCDVKAPDIKSLLCALSSFQQVQMDIVNHDGINM